MIVLFVVPFLIFISKHSPNKLSLYIVMEMAVVIACLVILLAISRQNMMALVTAQLAGAVYFSSAILIQNNKRNEVPK
jgi:heme/copper-type cytochrome/quinol oxidase subunit 4